MQDSTVARLDYAGAGGAVDLPAWKSVASTVCAILLAILFFVSGAWKLAEPLQWSQALTEFRVPAALALPGTVALGIAEMLGAVLIAIPRLRRWGSWIIAALLVLFIAYIGANYSTLAGKDCSCFPLVKRAVGPGFFIGDGVMLAMAAVAGLWARAVGGWRMAALALGAIAVFAGVSLAVNVTRASGIQAPASITVDGHPYALTSGDIFLFFYDPECMHCDAAARRMATLNWKDTRVVAIPTRVPQFAAAFLHDTKLRAGTSLDVDLLRKTFKFVDPPYGVALVDGRQKLAIANWDESEPAKTLRPIGFVQ